MDVKEDTKEGRKGGWMGMHEVIVELWGPALLDILYMF